MLQDRSTNVLVSFRPTLTAPGRSLGLAAMQLFQPERTFASLLEACRQRLTDFAVENNVGRFFISGIDGDIKFIAVCSANNCKTIQEQARRIIVEEWKKLSMVRQ